MDDQTGSKSADISARSRGQTLERLKTDYSGSSEALTSRVQGPEGEGDLLRLLQQRLEDNRIGLRPVHSMGEVPDAVANYVFSKGYEKVLVAGQGDAATRLAKDLADRLPGARVFESSGQDNDTLFDAEVGVAICSGVLAETGTLVLSGADRSELATTLLPRCQICVALESVVHRDLRSFLERKGFPPDLSHVMVSGPSRTADIEKHIVIGVHGPWSVCLFLAKTKE